MMKFFDDSDSMEKCLPNTESKPKPKFNIGDRVVAPFRYPDEDGYFGMSEVVAIVACEQRLLYELKNRIQIGKYNWIGYHEKKVFHDMGFAEDYNPAEECQLYQVEDNYTYRIGEEFFTSIQLEHCCDLDG